MLSEGRRKTLERILTWVLAVALLASLAGVLYVAVTPQETADPYTEFYVLGPDGTASGYPTNLSVGERGEFVVGTTNHEHREMRYTVVVATNASTVAERTVTVADGATREERFAFTPESAGPTRLQILLYRGDGADRSEGPYRRLRLVIDVREADAGR